MHLILLTYLLAHHNEWGASYTWGAMLRMGAEDMVAVTFFKKCHKCLVIAVFRKPGGIKTPSDTSFAFCITIKI